MKIRTPVDLGKLARVHSLGVLPLNSSTTSSYAFAPAVKGLRSDVRRHGPLQLIRTQHSGGSRNVLAILSFKNTDSYRFSTTVNAPLGRKGKEILNLFSPPNPTTGPSHSWPTPASGFIIVGKLLRK